MFNKLYLALSAWLTVKGLSFINCGNPIVACKAILVSKGFFKAQMKLCILSANLGAGLTEVCVFTPASSDKDIMNNTAFSFTDLEDSTVLARPQQRNPPRGPSTQKTSVRTFIKRLTWRHLLIACLIIALIVVVIAVSVHYGKKSNTAEAESCFPSPPGVRLDYSQDANFVAYVVLFWPWSSDMDNSSSQVYDERKIQADYLMKKIFQSSSRSSCITCVAKDMVKFGGNTLLLVQLNVTCESMTEGDIQNVYEEGYSRLLTTQDKSCVSNINPNISVHSIGEDRITGPSPISSTICGQSQLYPAPRIVGGQQVHRGQYPWVVMLLRDGKFYCGGTIWDYDHILTAAHCVDELTNNFTGEVNTSVLEVIAGKWESDVDGGYPGEQRVGVAAGRIHVNYSKEDIANDIAVLKLNQTLEPTQLVMKVCHPTADATLPEQGIVAGWGNTNPDPPTAPDSLLSVQLTVFDHHTCAQLLSFTLNTVYQLPVGTVCAMGNQLKDKDSCQGDSGGPLFWNLGTAADERHTVIGVVSYGEGQKGCGDLGLPGVYTSVQFFLDWIKDTVTFL